MKLVWGFWWRKISYQAFKLTYRYIRLACLRQIINSLISFQLGEGKGCAAELEEPSSGALCMVIVFQSALQLQSAPLLLHRCAGGKLGVLCARNLTSFCWSFINVGIFFFFSVAVWVNASIWYKFLVGTAIRWRLPYILFSIWQLMQEWEARYWYCYVSLIFMRGKVCRACKNWLLSAESVAVFL